jgi:hypothetical protein
MTEEEGAVNNPWKLATIGIAVIGTTALATGLTTAWVMRPSAPTPLEAPQPSARTAPPGVTPVALTAPPRVVAAPARIAPAPVRTATAPRVVRPAATRVAVPPVVPADCVSTGDRVWRIAKPAGVGGLVGAGVGAAGGAIADGGRGAAKGALIGGLAGAVLGGGYGAYTTKQECGSVLGGNRVAADFVQAMR